MKFKAVVFDFGDTLILTDQWDHDRSLENLLKSLQHDNVMVSMSLGEFRRVYFEVRSQMYRESEQSLREVDFRHRIAETLKRCNSDYSRESLIVTRAVEAFLDAFIEDVRMEDHVPPLLFGLKEKYKLGLVSNFAYPPGFWRVLHRFNLHRFFRSVVVSGELGLRKPHPKIFQKALEALEVEGAEAVFVGDSLKADIFGAKRMGLKTVLVENVGIRRNPYAIPGELDPFPVDPEMRITSLRELPKVLDALQVS